MKEPIVKSREDLVGLTGSYTRTFEIIEAKEYVYESGNLGGVEVRISDDMGNTFWTSYDNALSMD
jgi:hypothetical protein